MKTRFAFRTFLLLCLLCLWGGANCAFAQGKDDFSTISTNTSYSSRKSTAGWTATNAAVKKVGDYTSLTINGKTSAFGTITSPTLTGGCGVLTLNYANTNNESNGVSFHVDIKQNDDVVKSFDVINKSVTKETVYSYTSEALNVEGDFVIYIKNNCPSNKNSNADRVSIFNISWTAIGGVTPPTITPSSQTFSVAFTATIAAEDGADIYYTTNGDDPTTESSKYENGVEIPAATTTLKAIAVKDGATSEVSTAIYTYEEPIDETLGTFDNPLTPEQLIKYSTSLSKKKVWVKGNILGQANSSTSGNGYIDGFVDTNIAIGESGFTTCIAVQMKKLDGESESYAGNVLDYTKNTELLNKPILVYGTVDTYFSRPGIKPMMYFAFPGETISVNTEEGYSTYYYASAPTLMPTGVNGGTVTISNDKMTIDYKYNGNATLESGDLVPAAAPVLIKAEKKGTYPLIYSASNKGNSAGTQNLVGQETTGTITTEDGYYYYKLAYDDYTAKTDLGFYWGAEDGGVFSVPAGKAYLKVAKTADVAVTAFRFDGTTVTGIGNVATDGAAQQVKSAYTIDGRRVDANRLTKGIYIVNGKKVVVK